MRGEGQAFQVEGKDREHMSWKSYSQSLDWVRKRAHQPVHAEAAQSVLQPKRIAVFPVKREWKAYQGLHILTGNNK